MFDSSDVTSANRQRIRAEGRVSAKPDKLWQTNHQGVSSKRVSVIDKLYQQGSARIRFPNTEPGELQAVLLNTAGGLTGEDNIHWHAAASQDAHLCVSTAACEKIYRTHGPASVQQTSLKVAANARLEWLPQESILFNGSYLKRSLHVHLEEQAEALLVESLVFGRQAMNEAIDMIHVHDRWRIHRGKHLLHAEDFRLNMNKNINAQRQCVLHQYSALSTVVLVTVENAEWCHDMVSRLQNLTKSDASNIRIGASVLPSRIVVRILASNSFQLRKFLIPCIELLNEGRSIPAVWNV